MRHVLQFVAVILLWCNFAYIAIADELTKKLLRDLNSSSYVVREKATKHLLEQDMDFELYIKLRDAKNKSAETCRRIEYIVKPFEEKVRRSYRVDLEGRADYPWVCYNFPEHYRWRGMRPKEIQNQYLFLAYQDGMSEGHTFNSWTDWSYATKLWLEDRLAIDCQESLTLATSEMDFKRHMLYRVAAAREDMIRMRYWHDRWYSRPGSLRHRMPPIAP